MLMCVGTVLHASAQTIVGRYFRHLLLRGAFLDGAAGWRFHTAQAHYVLEKYRRLRALS